jgi:putative ABC transport system substrate-binding protein
MHRRSFVIVMAGIAMPALASAQPVASMRRIAILDPAVRALRADQWQVLEARLRELGYVEGRNLAIERRWADGVDARLPQLAQELLAGKPEVVLVTAVSEGTYTDKAGYTFPPVGLGSTAVFVRRGGEWRVIHYHQSVAK